jgi:hypothetical protein
MAPFRDVATGGWLWALPQYEAVNDQPRGEAEEQNRRRPDFTEAPLVAVHDWCPPFPGHSCITRIGASRAALSALIDTLRVSMTPSIVPWARCDSTGTATGFNSGEAQFHCTGLFSDAIALAD